MCIKCISDLNPWPCTTYYRICQNLWAGARQECSGMELHEWTVKISSAACKVFQVIYWELCVKEAFIGQTNFFGLLRKGAGETTQKLRLRSGSTAGPGVLIRSSLNGFGQVWLFGFKLSHDPKRVLQASFRFTNFAVIFYLGFCTFLILKIHLIRSQMLIESCSICISEFLCDYAISPTETNEF